MKLSNPILVGILLLPAACLWSQTGNPSPAAMPPGYVPYNTPDSNTDDDRMMTPPTVSGQSYPTATVSQERSNYLRGGVTFQSAYSDNVLGATGSNGTPVSDVSYSIWPVVALDETTTRLHWNLNYAPGFTFYQRASGRNEADQNATLNLEYRLSQHVTFSAADSFQKSSNIFNQPDPTSSGTVSGGVSGVNFSVISPITAQLRNSANLGLTYQFAANQMVGVGGSFANLHYPNESLVPGLFDSAAQSGSVFYALRVAEKHYIGVTYQYQRLLSYPMGDQNETRTNAILLLYTVSPFKRFTISMFGGPQLANISPQFSVGATTPQPGSRTLTAAAGGSASLQWTLTSAAVSFSHTISNGGGLIGAAQLDAASASFGQQLFRSLSASVSAGYANSTVVGGLSETAAASTTGHSISGTAALRQMLGQHFDLQLGYTRMHQSFNVAAITNTPELNREFISISYQFTKALGR